MTTWQAILTFGGIPAAFTVAVILLVLLTSHPRVPEGIAAARAAEANEDPNDAQPATATVQPDPAAAQDIASAPIQAAADRKHMSTADDEDEGTSANDVRM